jgi:hypothetical protein
MIDVSFVNFFKTKSYVIEGGNVRVKDSSSNIHGADEIDLQKHSRAEIAEKLLYFFHVINLKFEELNGEKIWPNIIDIDSGHIFNGSSEHFFNSNISDEDFIYSKKAIGDIDVTVPNNKKHDVFNFLTNLREQQITKNVAFLGIKQETLDKGHQISTLVRIDDHINIQIDFEFLEYVNGRPSEFAKFSHSSSWEDIKQGLKGVLHKYLLQALCKGTSIKSSSEITLFTKAATKEKPRVVKNSSERGISLKRFSVDRGLRTDAYVPYYDEDGNAVSYEGKAVYKERPTEESTYITNVESIAKEIFGTNFSTSDIYLLNSFLGLVELSLKYFNSNHLLEIFNDFRRRLFGINAQKLKRNDPVTDFNIKRIGFQELKNKFKITSVADLPLTYEELMTLPEEQGTDPILLKIKTYYQSY